MIDITNIEQVFNHINQQEKHFLTDYREKNKDKSDEYIILMAQCFKFGMLKQAYIELAAIHNRKKMLQT